MNNLPLRWIADDRNTFTLVNAAGEFVCTIAREYEQKLSAHGYSNEVNDTEKPMVWFSCFIEGGRFRPMRGAQGMTVREAKALALEWIG